MKGAMTTLVDLRRDEQLCELERVVLWLMRGSVGLGVCLGLLGWWVLVRGCW